MTENGHTIKIPPKANKRDTNSNLVALKRIENYCYFLSDEIGLGFTSHVYKGKCQVTNKPVAVKVIDLKNNQDELQQHFINEEITVLEKIKEADATNLLKLQCVIKTKNNLYIITQLCEGKDLAKVLRKKKKMNETEAQSIMKQVLNGYKQLYNLQIVHRDLKLANLFITKGTVKMADFGFAISQKQCHHKMDYNVGSPYYMPPQALKDNVYSYKSDVWGLGVIAYQLVYGRVPWKDKDQHVIYDMMMNGPIQKLFDDNIKLSDHYKKFIISCLTIDINQRATPQFIINYDWPEAQKHVEGMQQFQRSQSIGKPIIRNPIQGNKARRQSIERVSPRHQQQKFNRQRSKSMQRHLKTVMPMTSKNINNNQIGQFSRGQSQGEAKYSEQAFAGQIYYCKFMHQLYNLLKKLPEIQMKAYLQSELKARILQKIDKLRQGVIQKENILLSPGFTSFIQTKSYDNIVQIILKHADKYHRIFGEHRPLVENNQHIARLIQNIYNQLPNEVVTLEHVVYYYQIKGLEVRQNHHNFYEKSRINYLVMECDPHDSFQSEKVSDIKERLSKKLALLGILEPNR